MAINYLSLESATFDCGMSGRPIFGIEEKHDTPFPDEVGEADDRAIHRYRGKIWSAVTDFCCHYRISFVMTALVAGFDRKLKLVASPKKKIIAHI